MDNRNQYSGYDDDDYDYEPRTKTKKNTGCAATFLYLAVILLVSVILSVAAIFVANDVFAFVKDDKEVVFKVENQTNLSDLSKQLDKEGIVNYGTIFKLFLLLTDKDDDVLAGSYQLSPAMDYNQIVRSLRNTETQETVKVTIPEGYTLQQIKDTLIENGVCTAEELNEALNTYPFKHTFLEDQLPPSENWLEGYLFPDTYTFYKNGDAVKDVVNKMLNNFDTRYDENIINGAAELGLSIEEVVIIASLIEREAKIADEFTMISGVIHNRLNSSDFPYLQIDASVLYGLGRTSGTLTSEELDIDTPYNTYTRKGLPEGPICNPGYNALYAATHPTDHNYYYYVAMPDGSHLFASTNSQHEANISKANAAFAEVGE